MNNFIEAEITNPKTLEELKEMCLKHYQSDPDKAFEEAKKMHERAKKLKIYINDIYQVAIDRCAKGEALESYGIIHLSIKRIDREPIHDWRDLQEIKNKLVGPEYEAIELYPAEERLVDSANQYHLWLIDDPTFRFPFGFTERLVVDGTGKIDPESNTKQRPLKK